MADDDDSDELRVATLFTEDGKPVVMTILGKAHETTPAADEDRRFVASYLHHRGTCVEALTTEEGWELYCLGDGFGRLSPEELAGINDGWDWSHVRDSSPAALAAMRVRIEAILAEKRRG